MIDIELTAENVREVMARKDLDQCRIHIRGDTRGWLPLDWSGSFIGELVVHPDGIVDHNRMATITKKFVGKHGEQTSEDSLIDIGGDPDDEEFGTDWGEDTQ